MLIFYKKWKKCNEIQLTKNKMDLNIRKMTNQPPSPARNTKCKVRLPQRAEGKTAITGSLDWSTYTDSDFALGKCQQWLR